MSNTSPPKINIVADHKPAPKKSDRTRQALLDAALEFLWTRPFREMTVAHLTTIAGCSRPTFYQYFGDLHALMEMLLTRLSNELSEVTSPWFLQAGSPATALMQSMQAMVQVCYQQGPILRAVVEASTTDERLEQLWSDFNRNFDDEVVTIIEQQQALGLIPAFDARPIAMALNQLDVAMLINAFGRHPRSNPDKVCSALARIWVSTLYGRDQVTECDKTPDTSA